MPELQLFEGDLRKTELKFSEDYKAKSPSNIAYFPPIIFLIIINILLNHNIAIFLFDLCY